MTYVTTPDSNTALSFLFYFVGVVVRANANIAV